MITVSGTLHPSGVVYSNNIRSFFHEGEHSESGGMSCAVSHSSYNAKTSSSMRAPSFFLLSRIFNHAPFISSSFLGCSCPAGCTPRISGRVAQLFPSSRHAMTKGESYPRATHLMYRNLGKIPDLCTMDSLLQVTNGSHATRLLPVASIGTVVAVSGAITSSTTTTNPHSAVISTLTQLAVTAIAIASGACLSTQVESLWPRNEESPEQLLLEGVDVTGYKIFLEPEVVKAVSFAKEAHAGQMRKTGEPYLTHCLHTAKILAALVPETGNRAINTVVAGILHDVIDDTHKDIQNVRDVFGADVARLVAGVSRLSHINQLLRRHRRTSSNRTPSNNGGLTQEEVNSLRVMLLGMVNDPRVVLIKLADRLHNMRTIYALPQTKAYAVAQETLAVWCSLASRLGVWAVKAELEDLCFAVLRPQIFCRLRAELAAIWSPDKDWRYFRRMTKRAKRKALLYGEEVDEQPKRDSFVIEGEPTMKELLESVIPFDVLEDRRKRRSMLGALTKSGKLGLKKTKVMRDAEVALASLAACEEALERELLISTSYIPGMEVTLSGRLKSLYSTYSKMKRKNVSVDQIYDARALRVIVGDGNGKFHVPAVEGCYNVLSVVHRLWTPIGGEFDDYILNPKPSRYQSLHTAVEGPDGAALEVQIRTQGMHEHAEYGHAAHWLYKEADNGSKTFSTETVSSLVGQDIRDGVNDLEYQKVGVSQSISPVIESFQSTCTRSIQLGDPVLRIEGGRLLAGVILRVDRNGRDLLVAISFALHAREVASGRSGNQRGKWFTYAQLYKKEDQFERPLPTFIQFLELNKQEEAEYWEVMDAVLKGEEVNTSESLEENQNININTDLTVSTEARLNNKVRLLRSMLQWERQLHTEAASADGSLLSEVLVIRWPDGEIMRMPAGSTAADAAWKMGMEGKFIFINGHIAPPYLGLQDGDIVEVRM
ncbi:hypothetical protein KP509_24G004600 [Ceratopteris richardii]|uniref:GTP diphosphokinase n=1 Tax=Ceratopteris richardii TaxID=49495 RepID=A0A8T2RUK8_CERRI|nr:hypothetical protein KP509_24G004600 [Ceratopteris richardii]